MKPMTVGSFLGYASAGLIIALAAWDIQSCASSDDRVHPGYQSYLAKKQAYVQAKNGAEAGVVQRRFEESLAGLYPVDKLPNADLQEVARGILWVGEWSKNDKPESRYNSAARIAGNIYSNANGPMLTNRRWQVQPLLRCNDYGENCSFEPAVSVLGDPSRLVLLLNGDRAGVLSSLPSEIGDVGVEPAYPKDGPRSVELPWTYSLRVWIVCSIIFALVFMIVGAIGGLVIGLILPHAVGS